MLVRAGYAAGAQAAVDTNAPAVAERTLEGPKADWWFNDPNLPRGTKLYLAPAADVVENAQRYLHLHPPRPTAVSLRFKGVNPEAWKTLMTNLTLGKIQKLLYAAHGETLARTAGRSSTSCSRHGNTAPRGVLHHKLKAYGLDVVKPSDNWVQK